MSEYSPTRRMWKGRFEKMTGFKGVILSVLLYPVHLVKCVLRFLYELYFTEEYIPLNVFAWLGTIFGLMIAAVIWTDSAEKRGQPLSPNLLAEYIQVSDCYSNIVVPLMKEGVTLQAGHHLDAKKACGITDLPTHIKQQEILKKINAGK